MHADSAFNSRNKPYNAWSENLWIDYWRSDQLFGVRCERRNCLLIAELMDAEGKSTLVAQTTFEGKHQTILHLIAEFVEQIERILA